jgi:hypothetical protein
MSGGALRVARDVRLPPLPQSDLLLHLFHSS